jgi:hypothetical protein
MRYKWFCQCGLFTGSGVAEAACKSVIGQRLKQSGITGSPTAQTPSSPYAAGRPAASGKPSATPRTLRHEPPDRPRPQDDLGYLVDAQICHM